MRSERPGNNDRVGRGGPRAVRGAAGLRRQLAAGLLALSTGVSPAGMSLARADGVWQGSIEHLLNSQPERFATVMQDPARYRVQVIYTQIDRDADNRPSFRSFSYRLDDREYFYPASTVKLPVALLALEKLRALGVDGLDRDTAMLTGTAAAEQTAATEDRSSPSGLPSVAQYVRKILLVSDNDAFNRLYEFVGQQRINEQLRSRGIAGTRIVHRLSLPLSADQNRHTNPVRFVDGPKVLYEQGATVSRGDFAAAEPLLLGAAERVDGQLRRGPKDFAGKNAYPLQAQHDVLKTLLFPDSEAPGARFGLSAGDYRFVYRYLSMYPAESGIAGYADRSRYPDGYVKFLLFGGDTGTAPSNLRVFNKAGEAYGFLSDAAYIVDFDSNVEFMLAATIYANANQTFNDDQYEYEETGLPFLRDLGRAILEIERARPRNHRPDLSSFRDLFER